MSNNNNWDDSWDDTDYTSDSLYDDDDSSWYDDSSDDGYSGWDDSNSDDSSWYNDTSWDDNSSSDNSNWDDDGDVDYTSDSTYNDNDDNWYNDDEDNNSSSGSNDSYWEDYLADDGNTDYSTAWSDYNPTSYSDSDLDSMLDNVDWNSPATDDSSDDSNLWSNDAWDSIDFSDDSNYDPNNPLAGYGMSSYNGQDDDSVSDDWLNSNDILAPGSWYGQGNGWETNYNDNPSDYTDFGSNGDFTQDALNTPSWGGVTILGQHKYGQGNVNNANSGNALNHTLGTNNKNTGLPNTANPYLDFLKQQAKQNQQMMQNRIDANNKRMQDMLNAQKDSNNQANSLRQQQMDWMHQYQQAQLDLQKQSLGIQQQLANKQGSYLDKEAALLDLQKQANEWAWNNKKTEYNRFVNTRDRLNSEYKG